MPDAWRVTIPDDPSVLLSDIALAILGIGLVAWLLPRQLRRARQYGGRPVSLAVVAVGIVVLAISLQPELFDINTSLTLTIIGLVIALQPEAVVRMTGGPSLEWRALAEGTKLQRMVAVHADRRTARHLPDVRARLAALATAESSTTARYIELIGATIFADPESPGMADRFAALAVEEAKLRKVVGPKPSFDGGLVAVEESPVRARESQEQPTTGTTADMAEPAERELDDAADAADEADAAPEVDADAADEADAADPEAR
jgi:hypothetical protein